VAASNKGGVEKTSYFLALCVDISFNRLQSLKSTGIKAANSEWRERYRREDWTGEVCNAGLRVHMS